jgi:nickel transport protein
VRSPSASARAQAAAALVALLAAPPASGHEVLHEVVRGRAVAVHAVYADGEPLAYVAYEVFSPADPRVAHQKGRTDRNGWLAFVPDAAGGWRVRLSDTTGHGLDTTVEVDAQGAAANPAAGAAGVPSGLVFLLRPLVGVLLAAAIFAALFAWRRRKGRSS